MVISLMTTGKKEKRWEKMTMMMKSLIRVRQYSKTLPCLEGSLKTHLCLQNGLQMKKRKKMTNL